MSSRHAELVEAALARAAARRADGAPQPDDVLAVEVRRLRGLIADRSKLDRALAGYRARAALHAAALRDADARTEQWRDRALAAEREGHVSPEHVREMRRQLDRYRSGVATAPPVTTRAAVTAPTGEEL